jgi:Family of unknown function (DUF6152)
MRVPFPKTLVLACVASALAPAAAYAHHSAAAFDVTKQVTIAGTIEKLDWKNPHVYLTLQIQGADGRPQLQQVEADGVSGLQTSGLTPQKLASGARVEVRAALNRRGAGHTVWGLDVTTSDGAIYPLTPLGRSTARPATTVAAQSFAGEWAPTTAAFVDYFRAAMAAPLTDVGRARLAEAAQRRPDADHSCDPPPVTQLMMSHVLHTIEIAADAVAIGVGGPVRDGRTVHLDQDRHPDHVEPSLLGHSIGHWEGRMLVIDTVGFPGGPLGSPGGPKAHLVERLSLTEDRLRLQYETTLEDPEIYTAPFTHTELWEHRPDLAPAPEACDPENARRFLTDEQ